MQTTNCSCCPLIGYVLPQVAKLSKTLRTEKLEITAISGLVDSVLHSLDDAVSPSANWVLCLIDLKGEIEEATGIKFSTADVTSFQKKVMETFIKDLKNNIASRFSSQLLLTFSIPKQYQKLPLKI